MKVKLPGRVLTTNGEKEDQSSVFWEFKGDSIQNKDGVMFAESIDVDWYFIGGISGLLVIIILLIVVKKKSKNTVKI